MTMQRTVRTLKFYCPVARKPATGWEYCETLDTFEQREENVLARISTPLILMRQFFQHLILVALFLLSPFLPRAHGVTESVSETFVATATDVPGTSSTTRYVMVSVPVFRPIVTAGVITGINGNSVTDTDADWIDDQFNNPSQTSADPPTHYLEIITGPDAGLIADIIDTDGSSKTLTLPSNIGDNIDQQYIIRRHQTLGSIFGADNSVLNLLEGNNFNTAENILITTASGTKSYFFGFGSWLDATFSNANDTVVYPEQGVMIQRKTSDDKTLFLSGALKSGPTIAPVHEGYNMLGTIKVKTDLTLSQLNIPAVGGNNFNSGDNILITDGNGATQSYFYFSSGGSEGWLNAQFSSADDVPIPAGSAFLFLRQSGHGAFDWTIPEE